jgi:glycogen phosphorylase
MQPTSSKPFSYEPFPPPAWSRTSRWRSRSTPRMPTYSGGLGVLAGDTLRSAADLGVPLVAFTLAASQGLLPAAPGWKGRCRARRSALESGGFLHRGAGADHGFSGRPHRDGALLALRPGGPLRARGAHLPAGHRSGRQLGLGSRPHRSPLRRRHQLPLAAGDCAGHGRRAHGQRAGPPCKRLPHERGPRGAADAGAAREPAGRRTAGRGHGSRHRAGAQKCVFTTHTPVPAGHDRFSTEQTIRILGGDRTARLEKLGCFATEC